MKHWEEFAIEPEHLRDEEMGLGHMPLGIVYHITHIDRAINILKEGALKAQRIGDQGIFEGENKLANWLSPNHWIKGSRYGTIRFTFMMETMLDAMNIYWVGTVDHYTLPACRFLISPFDYKDRLEPYDPYTDKGPWQIHQEIDLFIWNNRCCLEFMIEQDISLDTCQSLDYVDHHSMYCSVGVDKCPELGFTWKDSSAQFIASLLTEDAIIPIQIFTDDKYNFRKKQTYTIGRPALSNGLRAIFIKAKDHAACHGQLIGTALLAPVKIREALQFIARREQDHFLSIANEFISLSDFRQALYLFAAQKFGIEDNAWKNMRTLSVYV